MPLYLLCLALRALNAGWFVVDDTDGFGREGVPLVLLRQLWVYFGTLWGGGKRWIWKGGSSGGAAIKVLARDSSALLLSAASFKLSSCWDWFWWAPFYELTFRYLVIFLGRNSNHSAEAWNIEIVHSRWRIGWSRPAGTSTSCWSWSSSSFSSSQTFSYFSAPLAGFDFENKQWLLFITSFTIIFVIIIHWQFLKRIRADRKYSNVK